MRIAIVAPGGVGGYFGASLAKSGEKVVALARGPHLDAIPGKWPARRRVTRRYLRSA